MALSHDRIAAERRRGVWHRQTRAPRSDAAGRTQRVELVVVEQPRAHEEAQALAGTAVALNTAAPGAEATGNVSRNAEATGRHGRPELRQKCPFLRFG